MIAFVAATPNRRKSTDFEQRSKRSLASAATDVAEMLLSRRARKLEGAGVPLCNFAEMKNYGMAASGAQSGH
jgi:hypothetical protein